MTLSIRTPIIKVVGENCNLRCSYCFYNGLDQKTANVMEQVILEDFLRQYFSIFSGNLRFIWHGGEPLLAGIPFYEEVLRLQWKYSKKGDSVENMIQTNGTLLDDDWAEFLSKNHFRVGVSIDGTANSHNRFRRDVSGNGTFDRVVLGIETLKKHNVIPGVIQTMTRGNLSALQSDFNFFTRELGLNGWAVNLYASSSTQNTLMFEEGLTNDEVTALYKQLIEIWLDQDDENLYLREIDHTPAKFLAKTDD